jgi:putative (di)nucleoside polyphosphate hydrolase
VVAFKREVYVRALHHLAPFARRIAGDGAIPMRARPVEASPPARPEPMRRRMP